MFRQEWSSIIFLIKIISQTNSTILVSVHFDLWISIIFFYFLKAVVPCKPDGSYPVSLDTF